MRKYYQIYLLLTAIAAILLSQTEKGLSQTRPSVDISNLPYYNFGKGVGLTSPDSIFQFNIRFRIQNRFTVIKNEGKNLAFDGQIRRLRLRFDGYVGNPDFLYVLQLSFAPGDVGTIESGENLNIIRDAVVYYRFNKKWNVGFGQTKLPGNRQRVNSSGALQLADRTITNGRFNIDRDFGFFLNHFREQADAFSWNVRTAITTGDGRNYTKSPDNGLAYTAKLELLPFGKFSKDGVYFEGDLFREPKPKLMISGAYHYNHKAKRQAGVLGDDLFEARNIRSLLLDAMFKYRGLAVMGSYMNRNVNNRITQNAEGEVSSIYTGYGRDLQLSYMFKNHFEIIGRYSVLTPTGEQNNNPSQMQYTLGATKYIWEHAFKIQLEASLDRIERTPINFNNNYNLRLQVEMGI
jgi:phosphate-selective porin OprO/OprP